MSEEKCYLEGMPWCRESSRLGCDTSWSRFKCIHCKNYTCTFHLNTSGLCDKCTTLENAWSSTYHKEKYEKIYITTTKPCRS